MLVTHGALPGCLLPFWMSSVEHSLLIRLRDDEAVSAHLKQLFRLLLQFSPAFSPFPIKMAAISIRVYSGRMSSDSQLISRSGSNPLAPSLMSAGDRRRELCAILAAGLVRLRSRQSSELSAGLENGLLDCPGDQSGHATATQRRNA
ncbi:MAG: hypothetical protein MEQ84_14190 [Mesorhizobium sp.]|nr:hypothetical protein [Mesorhizobium sp.]